MKKFNVLITASAITLLLTACVKPAQDPQPVYTDTTQPAMTQPVVYEQAQGVVYEPAATGTIYEEIPQDTTVITPPGAIMTQPSYPTSSTTSYPDPYATSGGGGSSFPDPYASQPVISDYPGTTSYPATTSAPAGQGGGGIHLQIAALKDYYTAEDYKNRLSLAPGMSAYVQRGAMNKVIVTGIPSVAEANRLKESRFPGAFIVQGASSGGYTPSVQPNYDTSGGGYNSGGAYSVNNPYGSSSSSSTSGNSGIGVQVGAFATQGKAQSVANNQGGKYPATVKKIGRYYKVILTGFSSRSAAKAHASRVGGFVVSTY